MKKYLLLLAFFGILSSNILIAGVSIELKNPVYGPLANGERQLVIPDDDTSTLSVTIDGYESEVLNESDLAIEGIENFAILGQNQSSSYQSFNGQGHAQISYNYTIQPDVRGEVTLGPVRYTIDGEERLSNTLNIQIIHGDMYQDLSGATSEDAVTCEIFIDKKNLVVGEPAHVSIVLSRTGQILEQALQEPNFPGCAAKLVSQKELGREFINGKPVDQTEFIYEVTPEQAGDLTLGPISAVYVTSSGQERDPFQGFGMGGSFFGSFFNQRERKRARSNRLSITVSELNGEFDAIGTFKKYKLSASKHKCELNEPLTLTATLEGQGNFDALLSPELELPDGMVIYPSDSAGNTGSGKQAEQAGIKTRKRFEYILQIDTPGRVTIPAQEFIYFDTKTRSKKVLRSNMLDFVVKGEAGGAYKNTQNKKSHEIAKVPERPRKQEIDKNYNSHNTQDIKDLFDDIAYIPRENKQAGSWFWVYLLLLMLCALICVLYHRALLFPRIFRKKQTSTYEKDLKKIEQAGDIGSISELFQKIIQDNWPESYKAHKNIISRELLEQICPDETGWDAEHRDKFLKYYQELSLHAWGSGNEKLTQKARTKLFEAAAHWVSYLNGARRHDS